MSIMTDWVNPQYLDSDYIAAIRESIIAKPVSRYAVLDNFFKEDKLDELISHHEHLQFSEELDRKDHKRGVWLPYDGAVVFARAGEHFGSELFYDPEWQNYCCYVTNTPIVGEIGTEVKLRYHRPHADGFWVHTDSALRNVVIICYFNKGWTADDGGLLQLWRIDEGLSDPAYCVDNPGGRLEFLRHHQRIRTKSPGGGFTDDKEHDLTLVDQVVPAYNRVFICNLKDSPVYHSVTPSNGKARLGFVQWLYDQTAWHARQTQTANG